MPGYPVRIHAPEPPRPPGMPKIKRITAYGDRAQQVFPEPPRSYPQSRLEWICFWWLTAKRHLVHNVDFFTQTAISAPGLQQTPFTRVDFVFFPRVSRPGNRGLCWDPITLFTHPDPSHDKLKRAILAAQGYQLIFIDGVDLEPNPERVLALAIRGIDVSTRSQSSFGR